MNATQAAPRRRHIDHDPADRSSQHAESEPATSTEPRIRVAIVDDHRSFAEALALAIRAEPDMTVAGVALAADDARVLLSGDVDVAVIDIGASPQEEIKLAEELKAGFPEVSLLLICDGLDATLLGRVLAADIFGYLPKHASIGEVMTALRSVQSNQATMPAALLRQVLDGSRLRPARSRGRPPGPGLLTDRELEVLRLVATGRTSKVIAADLEVSVNTVRSHAQRAIRKLGAHSRLQAIAAARAAGLFEVSTY